MKKKKYQIRRNPVIGFKTQTQASTGKTNLEKYGIWVVALFVLVLYSRVFYNGLTNRDDIHYILMNPFIRFLDWETIKLNFTLYYKGNYHPLSMLCLAVGYQLGGTHAWPYQLLNLILHVGNTVLVYAFITRLLKLSPQVSAMRKTIAIIVSLLFGIHTMQVESVAWISENKNVLYTFFFLSALYQYLNYITTHKGKYYLITLLFFLLALFSKAMAVTLSISLVLIDYFARHDLTSRKVILEKIPFFVFSAIFGITAIYAQKSAQALTMIAPLNVPERIAVAGYGFVQYLLKLVLPLKLSAFYEYPSQLSTAFPWYLYIYPLVAVAVFFVLYRFFRRSEIVWFGALFFFINICHVLQLLPVGDAIMADRYSYVPSIGFFMILGFIIVSTDYKFPRMRTYLRVGVISYVLLLCFLTFMRIAVWQDSLTLWNDVLAKSDYDKNSAAWLVIAALNNDEGKYKEALKDVEIYLDAHPDDGNAYFTRAYAKLSLDDLYGAEKDLNKSEELGIQDELMYNNRGYVKIKFGDYMGAIDDFSKAIEMNKGYTEAYRGRADVYLLLERNNSAFQDLVHVQKMDPDNVNIYNNLGLVKIRLGDYKAALIYLNKAIALKPDFMEALQNRVDARYGMEDYNGAIDDLSLILLKSEVPYAYYYRGKIYLKLGMHDSACADFEKALNLGYVMIDKYVLDSCKSLSQ
jgi:tetratricopeptide (TPR) repeat protein